MYFNTNWPAWECDRKEVKNQPPSHRTTWKQRVSWHWKLDKALSNVQPTVTTTSEVPEVTYPPRPATDLECSAELKQEGWKNKA